MQVSLYPFLRHHDGHIIIIVIINIFVKCHKVVTSVYGQLIAGQLIAGQLSADS